MSTLYWALAVTAVFSGVFPLNSAPYYEKWNQYFAVRGLKNDALFGYSIAYQKNMNRLFVGSPLASQTGNVYTCPIDHPANCEDMGVNRETGTDTRINSWLGATVNVGEEFVWACGPRFVENRTRSGTTFAGTYGRCYTFSGVYSSGLKMTRKDSISDEKRTDFHWEAYPHANRSEKIIKEMLFDSIGWSSHVCKDNSILVGGPAMSIGRAVRWDSTNFEPNLFIVNNAQREMNKNSSISFNFGYSVTSGVFNTEDEWYVISTPYGTYGNGKILFYSKPNVEIADLDIEGGMGQLFGGALASMKIDEYGTDALLVGAPAFVSNDDDDAKSFDIGALYVYIYDDEGVGKFNLRSGGIIKGYQNGGFFGSAISSLGDLDQDNVDEVAVAAPYENEGKGAVYIYSGKDLIGDGAVKYIQRIEGQGKEHHLGWSLHAAQDADENGCNELVIGVPGDNKVQLLRCITSVDVNFHAEFPDLTAQSKQLQTADASFQYKPCLKVVYAHPDKPKSIETEILVTIKIDHPNVTIAGATNGMVSYTAHLRTRQDEYCQAITVKLPKDGDYDYPVTFTMTASLVKNPLEVVPYNPNLVLMTGTTSYTRAINTTVLPSSNLTYEVSTSLRDKYKIGSTDSETLTMLIKNHANVAFSPCIRIRMEGVEWARYPHVCAHSGEWFTCTPDKPIVRGGTWNATVTLDTKTLTSANEKIKLYAELLTHCKIISGQPFEQTFSLQRDVEIHLSGISSQGIESEITKEALKDTEPQIEHIYFIKNSGATTWKDMVCEVTLATGLAYVTVGNSDDCIVNGTKAICIISSLKKNIDTVIRIKMEIESDSSVAEKIKYGKKVLLQTSVKLPELVKTASVQTTVVLREEPSVPLWIIIVAALVGLLILVIFAWILHECGFFRRNKKEQLDEIRQEIKRQSVRKSMMLRQSKIELIQNQTDRERLVQVPEEDSISMERFPPRPSAAELQNARKDQRKVVTTEALVH